MNRLTVVPLGADSRGNCIYVSDGEYSFFLDAGVPIRKRMKGKLTNKQVASVDACLVTHEHGDHSSHALEMADLGIDVYMTQGTVKALGIEHYRINIIEPEKPFNIGDVVITAFESYHDAEEPCVYLIETPKVKFCYVVDTRKAVWDFKGLTHVIVEANHDPAIVEKRIKNGELNQKLGGRIRQAHLSIGRTVEWLKSLDLSKTEQIYLTHLSEDHSDATAFKDVVVRTTGIPTTVLT